MNKARVERASHLIVGNLSVDFGHHLMFTTPPSETVGRQGRMAAVFACSEDDCCSCAFALSARHSKLVLSGVMRLEKSVPAVSQNA